MQNQVLNALVFLYKQALDQPLGDIDAVKLGIRSPLSNNLQHDCTVRGN